MPALDSPRDPAASLELDNGLTIQISQGEDVAWIDQVRVRDLGVDLPDLGPVPGVLQKHRRDVPKGVPDLHLVAIGVTGIEQDRRRRDLAHREALAGCRCCCRAGLGDRPTVRERRLLTRHGLDLLQARAAGSHESQSRHGGEGQAGRADKRLVRVEHDSKLPFAGLNSLKSLPQLRYCYNPGARKSRKTPENASEELLLSL